MTTPVALKTTSGAELPVVALPQTELLTVNANDTEWMGDPSEMVRIKPLRLDIEAGVWVVLVAFDPGSVIGLHYHTGEAEVYTLQGRWNYAEYPDQPQTAGSFLFEPAGSVHTLEVPSDNDEETIMFVRVRGANINFAENGTFESVLDATSLSFGADLHEQTAPGSVRYIRGGEAVTR